MANNPTGFCLVILALVALFLFGVMCGVMISIPEAEPDNEATFSIANSVGEDMNVTVFVLDGNDWDEISVSISNNNTIPLVITWRGDSRVNVHIVYDDWEDNERVLRYRVDDGEYRVVVLV